MRLPNRNNKPSFKQKKFFKMPQKTNKTVSKRKANFHYWTELTKFGDFYYRTPIMRIHKCLKLNK